MLEFMIVTMVGIATFWSFVLGAAFIIILILLANKGD